MGNALNFQQLRRGREKITKSNAFFVIFLIVLIAFLLLSVFLAVGLGTVSISFSDTYKIIIGKIFGNEDLYSSLSKSTIYIVWNLRVPRVLLGLLAGAGLSLCGAVMQSTVNNPIAEPYILGVSSGATFGATIIIALGLAQAVSIGSFLGAIIATFLVMGIASHKGKMTATRLILSGTVVNALFTAFSNFIISVFASSDSIADIKFWTMGSLASATYEQILIPAIVVVLAIVFFLTQARTMNVMMLGDETAISLGINLSVYRIIYMAVIALLTGVLVASCGIIGFVGLIIPHIVRGIVGTNHKKVLPLSIVIGAIFLIWADVLARTLIKDSELPIGIFTALVGAPFFIYIVVRKNYSKE